MPARAEILNTIIKIRNGFIIRFLRVNLNLVQVLGQPLFRTCHSPLTDPHPSTQSMSKGSIRIWSLLVHTVKGDLEVLLHLSTAQDLAPKHPCLDTQGETDPCHPTTQWDTLASPTTRS